MFARKKINGLYINKPTLTIIEKDCKVIFDLFQEALNLENPIEILQKHINLDSENLVKKMYYLQRLSFDKFTFVIHHCLGNGNQNEIERYLNIRFTDEDLKKIHNNSLLIYEYTDTVIGAILQDEYFNKPGLLEEKSDGNIKCNFPEEIKKYDFCYIENNIIYWYGQTQQLAQTIYYFKELNTNSEEEISYDDYISELLKLNIINLRVGEWISVRTQLKSLKNRKSDETIKSEYHSDSGFNYKLAVELISDIINKSESKLKK